MDKPGNQTVVLKYFGAIAKWVGCEEESVVVGEDFRTCVAMVRDRIQERTGGKVLYLVMYNGTNIARVNPQTTTVRDGDVFLAVPIALGG
jgi:molybdopterin converting factor small subunit